MRVLFWYYRAMNTWVYVCIIVAVAFASSVITYLLTRLRMETGSTERVRALAEAVAALENEKAKFEEAARGIEESAKRKALDEFLARMAERARTVLEMALKAREVLEVEERLKALEERFNQEDGNGKQKAFGR